MLDRMHISWYYSLQRWESPQPDIYKAMIYEDFNGAAPRFYAKFVPLLPQRTVLMEGFLAVLHGLPEGALVVDVGMGSGSLADTLFGRFPQIGQYIGIEPAEAMVAAIPSHLLADTRFSVVQQGFEDWDTVDSSVDAFVTRYVFHDFPDQLESWYTKIARMLKPGGTFVNLDVTFIESPAQTLANLNDTIRLAKSVVAEDEEELAAQQRFVQHLTGEMDRYRPVETHLALLRAVGLCPSVAPRSDRDYLLYAVKL